MHSTLGRLTLATIMVALFVVPSLATAQQGPYKYYAVTPCRAYDSRADTDGATPLSRGRHNFRLKGTCGIPATAKALTVNATVVGPNSSGWLVLWPSDATEPVVSTLNFLANEAALANGAIVPVDADAPGTGTCDPITDTGTSPGANCDTSVRIALQSSGSQYNSQLIFDITGYFQ
jgi:hypothetical protein